MINIRPVSDLRNKFPEIEEIVINTDSPVFLTKNGYGTMVIMSIEQYSSLFDNIERKLDQTNQLAESPSQRLSKEEIFDRARTRIEGREKI
ncbi:type II toxin-antitoxin system Phd/YefM family antitoxin [Anaerococcus provencensis]|uniref:type II toxin-antitoxin system Phd/YefM family antitoxin n=1 Tax=Anaerococcus provencensis TaxID=938293 RepID=UPI00031FC9AA|nr:type II toxin-antitoxin system Phd/YefM family antitoxin [Anaerococcus provencensis]